MPRAAPAPLRGRPRASYNGRMRDEEKRHLPWGPLSIAFFGMAFARAWLSIIFVGPDSGTSAFPVLSHTVFDIAYVAFCLAALAFARRLVPYSGKLWSYVATLAGMLVTSVAFVAQPAVPGAALPAVALTASAIGGIAFMSCSLLSAEVLVGVSILRIAIYLSGANLFSSLLVFLLGGAGRAQTAVALLLLPVLAVACMHAARGTLPEHDRQKAGYPRFQLPWKLLALVAVFSFVYGMEQQSFVAGAGRHSSLSTAIIMGVIFVVAYFFPRHLDIARLCRAPVPLMVCGVLLIPAEGLLGAAASSYLISIGFTLMRFLVGLMLYDMCKQTGVAILPLNAARESMQAFTLIGGAASGGIGALAGDSTGALVVTIIIGVLLVGSFVLLFSRRELSARWGIKVLEGQPLDQAASRDAMLASTCDAVTQRYHLTSREDEVLRELARGKDTAAIAQNLLIAPGTLRAHTRHIYEKIGIHSREELYEVLGLEVGVHEVTRLGEEAVRVG